MRRSDVMRRVKSRDTGPELTVRTLLCRMGHTGYRLDQSDLPSRPDIAFIGRRKAIFVHGCFWHAHDCPRGARVPKTNTDYWIAKITPNIARDRAVLSTLSETNWTSLMVWECQLKDAPVLETRLADFLASP